MQKIQEWESKDESKTLGKCWMSLPSVDPSVCEGNPWYLAPEVIFQSQYNQATDMWSLGLVLAELISGLSLYLGQSFMIFYT